MSLEFIGTRLKEVVIVEDQPLFCQVLRQLVEFCPNARVKAVITNGREALQYLARERPEIVVLDLGLPSLDGLSLMLETRKHAPKTRFLVVTANSDNYTMFRLSRAKVHGVVDKRSDDLASLRIAIQTVINGGNYYANSYLEAAQRRDEHEGAYAALLTEREREVLVLAGLGLSNREIGARLGISAETAERHRNNLFRKLQVRRTPKLMELAVKGGFTRIPPGGHGPPVYP